jgi:hypothetical protein
MNRMTRVVVVTLCVAIAWMNSTRDALGDSPSKLGAVIIRAAGLFPGQDVAKGVDAITHATGAPMNTYVFVDGLAKSLTNLNVDVRIVDFSECRNLDCLLPSSGTKTHAKVDIVVFAGPAYSSKLPNQLLSLFPKLGAVAKSRPDLVCSSLVAAWFPEPKGCDTAAHADSAFKAAGLRTVMGIPLLTPRGKDPGITQEALEKALSDFASQLVDAARGRATKAKD